MTKTGCSYGAVEDPRGGRCYGRDTTTTTTSHTSTNSKHDGVGMVSDGPDLRQCEDEARPSGKRRAAFGTGVVMIVLASSMVVGYVFGLTVAGVTEEEGVDVLLADTADARDRTSFTGREFTMEDEADEVRTTRGTHGIHDATHYNNTWYIHYNTWYQGMYIKNPPPPFLEWGRGKHVD